MWSALASGLLLLSAPLDDRTTRGWSEERVLQGLRSEHGLEVAWAAHEAGLRRLKRAVGPLLDVLEAPPLEGKADPVYEHVLDALILLGAELQPAQLAHLDLHNRLIQREVLVLLARSPARFEASLLAQLDEGPGGMSFHAIASLLAAIRSPGLAHRLLPRLRTELVVVVLDPGDMRWSVHGLGCGGIGTSGGRRLDSGWPPRFDYVLEFADTEEPASEVPRFELVSKPRPLVALREARAPRRHDAFRGPSSREVLDYLAQLAGLPRKGLGVPEYRRVTVEYTDESQLVAFVEAERQRILSAHDRLRESLATQGLLARDRWKETELRLELEIEDERRSVQPAPAAPAP